MGPGKTEAAQRHGLAVPPRRVPSAPPRKPSLDGAPAGRESGNPATDVDPESVDRRKANNRAARKPTEIQEAQASGSSPGQPSLLLMGWSQARLSTEIGEPTVIREESPAQIWQYQGNRCVLDIFFYEEEGDFRVVYAEARNHLAERLPIEPCLAGLRTGPAQQTRD